MYDLNLSIYRIGGVYDVMVTIIGNGHGDLSSNLDQACVHFTYC